MITQTATIPKRVSRGEELVVVRRSDFEMFRKWREGTAEALKRSQEAKQMKRRGKLPLFRSLKNWR